MRVLFFGGTERGFRTLQALQKLPVTVVGIISLRQDDHEVARFERSIQDFAEANHIPWFETKWMKDQDYRDLITNQLKPDLGIVVGCRILIPHDVYSIPHLGTLAVHDSVLPEYRGFSPLNWSIVNGEDHVGATLFYLSERMDGGDIVAQKAIPLGKKVTAPEAYEQICRITIELIEQSIPLLVQGKAPRMSQDYNEGSFTCSRTPRDGHINWERSTEAIHDQIRGLAHPYPGAFTYLKGQKLFINRAEILSSSGRYVGRIPGRVITISKSEGYVDILTGDGMLRVLEVKDIHGNFMKPSTVIQSIRTTLGIDVEELLERVQRLESQMLELSRESDEVKTPAMNV